VKNAVARVAKQIEEVLNGDIGFRECSLRDEVKSSVFGAET
jgi:hypothetical protein